MRHLVWPWLGLLCLVLGCTPPDDDDDLADDDSGDDDLADDDAGDDDTGTPLLTELYDIPHPADSWPGSGTGLTWMGHNLWVGYGWYLWQVDPGTGTIVNTHSNNEGGFADGEQFHGLAHDSTLWAVGYQLDKLIHFKDNPPVNGEVWQWSSGSSSAVALARDEVTVWSVNGEEIVTYDMSDDMLYAAHYPVPDYFIGGLTIGAGGPALWSCGLDLAGEGFVIVRHEMDGTMDANATFPTAWRCDGLATDGVHLWASLYDEDHELDKVLRKYEINH